MISELIGIIPSVSADDQCNICVIQLSQLICLLHQVQFPLGELLSFCFCCVWHVMRVVLQLGGRLLMGVEIRLILLNICVKK